MNCVIPGQNIKIMGKTIHAMAKIGDELYLQASADDLSFRTINMQKTAYAVFKFLPPFFTHYNVERSSSSQSTSEGDDLKCKIPMKAILNVFKSPVQLEKQVEICKIELENDAQKIIFKFRYKHDTNKIQSLYLLDEESMEVLYVDSGVPNLMSSQASLYSQALANFQLSDDEVSFDVNPQKIIMRNYVEGETGNLHSVRSQLTLLSSEFDNYKIGASTNITFSLKPFRAAVQFAEYFNLEIIIRFQTAGKPTVLVMSTVAFEVNFILGTIHMSSETQSSACSDAIPYVTETKCKTTENDENLTVQDKEAIENINWDNEFKEDEGDENMEPLVIPDSPESPRSKKMKHLFKRCFEPTYTPNQLEPDEIILNSTQQL